MILSSAEILGSFVRSMSALPSMMSIGASCGSATNPPNGSEPSEYWTPVIVFFQSRLAKPNPEFLDVEPAPRRGEKVPKLMHHDEQIKQDEDLKQDEDDAS